MGKIKKTNKKENIKSYLTDKKFVFMLLLIIIPAALYFRVVFFEYSGLDDIAIVFNINNVEGSPINLKNAFTHDAFMGDKGDTFYRPIQLLSLMLDAEVGGREPWIYHLSNLIFHIITVLILFLFLKKIGIKEGISFLISLIFSVNPLFTNAVAWIPARGDILLCLFSLLSFITFIDYLDTRKMYFIGLHAIVFLAAIFSKETAVLIPVLILSYFYFVQKKTFVIKEIIPFLTIWAISFVLFYSLRQSVITENPSSNIFGIIPFIKNLPAIPITFFKFFFPYSLSTMPLFDDFGLIGGIILLIVFFGITFIVIRKEWKILIWGGVWFLALSAPAMFYRLYFASVGIEYFEYRAYLPMVGILIAGGYLLNELTKSISYKKIIIISAPIILIYSGIAFIHSDVYANPFSFFNSAIKTNPNNAIALAERGIAYYNNGDKDRALFDFNKSISVCPANPIPYFNKGVVYNSLRDYKQAEYLYSKALMNDTVNQDLHMLKSDIYLKLSGEKLNLGKFDETKIVLNKGISKYQNDSKLHNQLGLAYYNMLKFDSAYYEYNKAIELDNSVYTYYDNRGMSEFHLKNYKGALNDFNRVLDMKPDFQDTWGSRGMTKIELNDNEGAVSDLTKAISYNSNSGAAYYFRGVAYSRLNKMSEAKTDWEKAMELGYKGAAELLKKQKTL